MQAIKSLGSSLVYLFILSCSYGLLFFLKILSWIFPYFTKFYLYIYGKMFWEAPLKFFV